LPVPPVAVATAPATVTVEGWPVRRLSQAEQEECRRLSLCYNWDEKFSYSHNRIYKRIFLLDGAVEDEEDVPEPSEAGANEEIPHFFLHVIIGICFSDTMQIRIALSGTSLIALLDSGSTHNFIFEAAAQRTGLPLQHRPQLTATVANGERVSCLGVICQAAFTVDGDTLSTDLFILPLAEYDVVLGTRWLATLGPVLWDFSARTMTFQQRGREVSWYGVSGTDTIGLHATTASASLLDELLASFNDVFAEPHGLPPPRGHDHNITLLPGSQPVVVRPYLYQTMHKDELERQCTAMLDQGLIRRSSSAFSSPVLLVKKGDGSWRFYVDYRALNVITVKDAFPIPVVNKLIDELHGAKYFSKLDMRSGYHQVWMSPADIAKTTFRTHDSLYEFLVTPFGLCNAPITF
jgi:hypothetical protein